MFGLELIFGSLTVTFLIGLFTVVLLYWYTTRNHDYWEKKKVPYVKPVPLFGSVWETMKRIFKVITLFPYVKPVPLFGSVWETMKRIFKVITLFPYVKPVPLFGSVWETMKRPLHEVEYERYMKLGPIYGHYEGNNPHISIGDPAILKDIMVKDFGSFTGRRIFDSGDKIVDNMLSAIRGEDWKRVRSIVTPTFTTGKIKRMLGIFKDCTKTLTDNLNALAKEGKPVDLKRMYGTFAMDVIASSAFSTKIDSHNDPENKFVQMAKIVFNQDFGIKIIFFLMVPKLVKLLKIPIFDGDATTFFKDMTLKIIEERKRTGQKRNDFLQLLIDTAKEMSDDQKGEVADKDKADITSNYALTDVEHQIFKTVTSKKLSLDELVAQSVIFFVAGYDTTASTISFATYFLAIHQDIQDRLREEVDAALEDNNGELSYEAIQNMKYLDNIISETLRYYPVVIRLERYADTNYTLGDTGITIEKGMIVSIPVYAMHRDPKLWPDPEKFDPDRFTPEERAKRDPYSYLPFGAGPRNCVAMRFALMEIKVCLAHVIANFKIVKSSQTKVPLEFNLGQQGLLQPKEVLVGMEVRRDSPLTKWK